MKPKVIDVFLLIDDAPLVLKRPLLPFAYNSYRIPLFVYYNPQINGWPTEPYYFIEDFEIKSILINGSRFPYIKTDHTQLVNPPKGRYTIHEQNEGKFICIAFDINTLWQYTRIEVVATDEASYSLYGTKDNDGDANPPMLLNVPEIKRKADALKYARFSFETAAVDLIWNKQRINLYGGEMALSLRYEQDGKQHEAPIGRHIINKISYDKTTAKINGVDFRYLLNTKYPIDVFTKADYPFIDDEYIDKVKPECIGIGNGIPGICLQGNQIYTEYPSKLTEYKYRFPPGWKKLYKIEIQTNDTWFEVWPGYGNPYFEMPPPVQGEPEREPKFPEYNVKSEYGIKDENIDTETGIVTIPARLALGEDDVGNIDYGSSPNKFRMYALWPNSAMNPVVEYSVENEIEEIIEPGALKFLMDASGDNTLSAGMTGEWDGLAEIGLYMEDSKPVFEWIEQLQSGNIIGGQLILINDLFQYKVEDPNRRKKLDIPKSDVLNHANLPVASADELWFSGWNIKYKKSWADSVEGEIIGETGHYPAAELYNGNDLTTKLVYPENSPSQQYFDTAKVQAKINIIRDTITASRHRIDALTVPFAKEYLDLEIYDVIGYLPEALEDLEQKNYEWIIYDKKINIKNETITLKIIERRRTSFWRHEPFVIIFDNNAANSNFVPVVPSYTELAYPATTINTMPTPPSMANYQFTGWNTRKDGRGQWVDETTHISSSMTVYAIWNLINQYQVDLMEQSDEHKIVIDKSKDEIIDLWGV